MVENNSLLDRILELTPLLRNVLGEDYAITVSDNKKFIYYSPGAELDHKVKPGDSIKEGSLTHRCLTAKGRLVGSADSKLYGFPYIGKVACVRDKQNNITGTLGLWLPITLADRMQRVASELVSAVGEISLHTTNLSATAEELSSSVQTINSNTNEMLRDVHNTDGILKLINEVSSQTHLLGLNAAIEAARAGEQGRGFNVVAEEIRKLAGRTNTSVKDIREIVELMKSHIEELATQISEISAVSQEQAASSQSMMIFVEKLNGISSDLKTLSAELIKKQ